MVALFSGQDTLYVHAWGKGKLHLLSYGGLSGSFPPHVGSKSTPNDVGPTQFIVGFSHGYMSFAIYWEGEGDAYLRIGTEPTLITIGKSWETATLAPYEGSALSTGNVRNIVRNAILRDERTTIFVVPTL